MSEQYGPQEQWCETLAAMVEAERADYRQRAWLWLKGVRKRMPLVCEHPMYLFRVEV